MKIRKLLLRAKLEQIEKENQNIFIFHCSANAAQWRFLKNFLYNCDLTRPMPTQSDHQCRVAESRQARRREAGALVVSTIADAPRGQSLLEEVRSTGFGPPVGTNTNSDSSFFRLKAPATLFAGAPSLKKTVLRAGVGPCTGIQRDEGPTSPVGDHLIDQSVSSLARLGAPSFRPRGCLFFFDTQSHNALDTYQKNRICLELVRKIESIEFNGNLVLLYGQMKSTLLNHVDLEQASSLDTQTTYQHFFTSIQFLSIALNTCLHQKIDEFVCIQERRASSENPPRA